MLLQPKNSTAATESVLTTVKYYYSLCPQIIDILGFYIYLKNKNDWLMYRRRRENNIYTKVNLSHVGLFVITINT